MTKISWDAASKSFSSGISNAVLYVTGESGVAWNGVVSIQEKTSDLNTTGYYLEGRRFLLTQENEDFEFDLVVFTYPDEFDSCFGIDGVYDLQPVKSFNLSYITGTDDNREIHLIYNARLQFPEKEFKSLGDDVDPVNFSWSATTRGIPTYATSPSAHYIAYVSEMNPGVLEALLDLLHGTDTTDPSMPEVSEIIDLFADYALFLVTDNGDGTWTAVGPDNNIDVSNSTTFVINGPSVVPVDDGSYFLRDF